MNFAVFTLIVATIALAQFTATNKVECAYCREYDWGSWRDMSWDRDGA